MSANFVRSFARRRKFLEALEMAESETKAAALAGGTIRQFRRWAEDDENFKKDWDDAAEAGTDYLEDVATERAINKSDPLMLHMLKVRRPDKHDRASKLELGGTLNVEGSRSKLLNRLAALRAHKAIESGQESQEAQEEVPEVKLLPAPGQEFKPEPRVNRGCKRRSQAKTGGRGAAAA
jgi:hypothetical protein